MFFYEEGGLLMIDFEFCEPHSIEEFYSILDNSEGMVSVLAGGTDVINHIRLGKCKPSKVIALKNIKDLSIGIEYGSKGITIGAMVTLSEIVKNKVMMKTFRAISDAADKVGSKQIRNRGTLIGNICNASPAADTIPALLIYNAVVNIIGRQARRSVPLEFFLKGPGKTDLKEGEIVYSVFLPNPPANRSCYLKLSRREGVDLAIVGVAALVSENREVRIGLGAVAPTAIRAYTTEKLLSEEFLNIITFENGLEEAVKAANPISDLRASREYRLAMIKVFIRKAMEKLTPISGWGGVVK